MILKRAATVLTTIALALGVALTGIAAAAKPDPATVGYAYLRTLFEADTTTAMQKALKLAAPGSVAADYAQHQMNMLQVERDNGLARPPASITRSGKKVKGCSKGPVPTDCSVFSAFNLDKRGRLVSFSGDGSPIERRLLIGTTQTAAALGATVKLLSAYQSLSGQLLVLVDVSAPPDQPRQVYASSATYVGSDGRQQQTSMAQARSGDIAAGATVGLVMAFDDAALGGTLRLEVAVGSPNYTTETVSLVVG